MDIKINKNTMRSLLVHFSAKSRKPEEYLFETDFYKQFYLKGVRNNRALHTWVVATGEYLRNETRQHNQLLDTS